MVIADQTDDGTSLLNLYRRLIAFRRYRPDVVRGGRVRIIDGLAEIVAYQVGDPAQVVLLNVSDQSVRVLEYGGRNVVVADKRAVEGRPFSGTLHGWGAVVLDPPHGI